MLNRWSVEFANDEDFVVDDNQCPLPMNVKKVLGFAVGPITGAAFGLVTVPVVAWIFTPEDIGRLNIVQITVSFSILLFVLGLDQAYVREFHESTDRFALLKTCFAPGFALLAVWALVTIAFGERISSWLFGVADPVFYWITLACVIASFTSRCLSLILRMQERGLAFSMSQVLPKALLLALVAVMALSGFRKEFLQLQLAFLASTVAVLLVYLWNTRRQWSQALGARLDVALLRTLLAYSVPLMFAGLTYWGLAGTSSLALRALSSFAELGVYSVSMSFAGIATIFQSIFSVVWAPIVYKWAANGTDLARVDGVARQALAVVCGIFVACGIFSWLIGYVLPIDYKDVKYLVLCSIAQPLLYTLSEVTCVGISITRRTTLSLWSTLIALVTNVALCLMLVPKYGAAGAVISNAIAFLVFFVSRTEASAFVWRKSPRGRLYVFVASATALSVVTVTLGPSLPFHYSYIWLAVSPLVLWCFRTEWVEMLGFARHAWSVRHGASSEPGPPGPLP